MPRRGEIVVTSRFAASVDQVWTHATTFEGINDEFRPLLRMTAPPDVRREGLAGVRTGERICRSWILLFGLLPVDYDDITLESLGPGAEFRERSTMLTQRLWHHDRTVTETIDGCEVTDRVAWEPRLPIPGSWLRPLYRALFHYRHRRLAKRFGRIDAA